ncbi:MAG: hypothetical protein KBD19_00285 [Candidatus Moranbacteria bacterium]|nr:hypothetical protein [Candidatus Moranbacteria bacterium]
MGTGRLFGIASLSAGIIFAVFFLVRDIVHDETFSPGSVNISAAPRTNEASAGSVLSETDSQEGRSETAGDEDFLRRLLGVSGNGIDIHIDEFPRHGIEAEHIDSNSVTSRTIRDRTIEGIDIDKGADLDIGSLNVSGDVDIAGILESGGLIVSGDVDILGDLSAVGLDISGDTTLQGDLTVAGSISGSFSGSFAPTGDVDMLGNIMTNIGDSGTDFTSSGGLTLAGALTLTPLTPGSIPFIGIAGVMSQDNANLFWDDTSNRLGIGTTSPEATLDVRGPLGVFRDITGTGIVSDYYYGVDYLTSVFQIDANIQYGIAYVGAGNNHYSVWQEYIKTRSTDGTTYAIVHDGDELGRFNFHGDDGSNLAQGAMIQVSVDGTPGEDDMPGRIKFWTTPAGANFPLERMTIKSTGNVGIGTASPTTKLDVVGNIRTNGYFNAGDVTMLNGTALYSANAPSFDIYESNASSKLYISASGGLILGLKSDGTNTGNVGIGTASPSTKLEISGDVIGSGVALTVKNLATSASYARLNLVANGKTSDIFFDGSGGFISGGGLIFRSNGDPLHFFTGSNNRVTINSHGKVGIGDTTPDGLLDIEPTGAATASSYGINLSNLTTNATTDGVNKYGAYLTSTGAWTGGGGTATNNYGLYVDTVSGADNNYGAYIAGNVGIGTTSPGAKLDVSGNFQLSGDLVMTGVASKIWGDTDFSYLQLYNAFGQGETQIGNGHTNGGIRFFTAPTIAKTYVEAMRITPTGNVGIGTTNPGTALDVGSGNIQTTGTIKGVSLIANGTSNFKLVTANAPASWSGNGPAGVLQLQDINGNYSTTINSNSRGLQTLGLYVDGLGVNNYIAGNVGIGTTSPGSKLSFVADTIAAGGITFGSDTNLYRSSADILKTDDTLSVGTQLLTNVVKKLDSSKFMLVGSGSDLYVGGSSGVGQYANAIFDISGNVGIGTTSPSYKLDVAGSIRTASGQGIFTGLSALAQNANGLIVFGGDNGGTVYARGDVAGADNNLNLQAFDDINFDTFPSGSPVTGMVIKKTGNVGIGTTSPTALLDLNSTNGGDTDILRISNPSASAGSIYGLAWRDTANNKTYARIASSYGASYVNSYLSLSVADSTETLQERMRIDKSGNVGIGTTSPSEKLDVNGHIKVNNYIKLGNNTGGFVDPNGNPFLYTTSSGLETRVNAYYTGGFVSLYSGSPNAERMRVTSAGNVGIGTTNQFGSGSGVLALGNATTNPTTTLTNAALLYATGGEMYVYDAAGNATQISPHDDMGLWHYNSTNTRMGKTLEVSMELLTKDLDRILGGGYVYENGDRLFSGENRIDSLSLRTDEYATTLGAFRASVDENLLSVSASLSDSGKDIDELTEKIEGLDAKMASTEESLEDRIVVLENGVTSRDTQISALMDFYSALDLGNVLLLDIDGNLTIPSGDLLIRNIEAQGTIRAEDVEAEDGITAGGIVAGAAIAAGEESSGSGTLKAGDDRTVIDTEYANEDAKIFITIKGSPHGKSLYVDDIEEGESFTVKVDGDVSDKDIDFFWFVLR